MYVCSVVSDSLGPHGLQPASLPCPWDFSGKNTWVGCHFLLQGIFPTRWLKLHLLRLLPWEVNSLPLSHLGSPGNAIWSSNPTPGYIYEKHTHTHTHTHKNSSLKRYMHFNVHRSIIYNFQDMEANYMSINRWMVKDFFFVTSRQFEDSHCGRCEVTVVWFGFLWWLEMISIFSRAH